MCVVSYTYLKVIKWLTFQPTFGISINEEVNPHNLTLFLHTFYLTGGGGVKIPPRLSQLVDKIAT